MTVGIVMGVSGSGKTTVAELAAASLGWHFIEGDDLHPEANVAKMHAGHPLTDEDRWPWLRRIAERVDAWRAQGRSGLVTCSALKRAYRDILVGDRPDVRVIYLKGDLSLISHRLAARKGHFMPPSLLQSQFDTLQEPAPDERPITVEVTGSPVAIARQIVAGLRG